MKTVWLLGFLTFFAFSCKGPSEKPKEPVKVTEGVEEKKEEPQILFENFTYTGKAQAVFLAGNFNQWKVNDPDFAFLRTSPEVWSLQVPVSRFLKGENQYKLIVDGQWILDPLAKTVKDTPLAGKVGVLIIK